MDRRHDRHHVGRGGVEYDRRRGRQPARRDHQGGAERADRRGGVLHCALPLDPRREGQAPSLGIVWEKFPKFILGFVAASLVFSLCQSNGLFTLGAKGKLLEPGVAKMFSTVFFSLAFVCIGLDTRLKDIISKENRNVLRSFLVAQTFNIVVTFVIACLLFGLLKPAL